MVDLPTAEHHGICPRCEGYGGGEEDDDHPCQQEDSDCLGSCPKCWCPGCHDGQSGGGECGTFEAYQHVRSIAVAAGQDALL